MSIAAMDVSDFEGGGVEGDDEQTVVDDLDHQQDVTEGQGGQYYHDRIGPTAYKGNRRSPPPPAQHPTYNHEYTAQPQPSHSKQPTHHTSTHSQQATTAYSQHSYRVGVHAMCF